ncbi:hypothetical protein F5Y16DRAFT_402018 [Xylariaceae sp. FL0255]|nr:hypothetical protein F5Y16DRAFT_402018 [Xylariaceae sp. FL0255]
MAAEVVSIVSQVGESILKLKRLWDQLKDVPASIVDLRHQIDCLNPILWEIANQPKLPSTYWSNQNNSRTIGYCREALNSLNAVFEYLEFRLNSCPGKLSRLMTSAKILNKRDRLQQIERYLHNAVRMLSLAQQSYIISMLKAQPDIIYHRLIESTSLMVVNQPQILQRDNRIPRAWQESPRRYEDGQQSHGQTHQHEKIIEPPSYPKRQAPTSRLVLKLPSWLCHKTWELQFAHSSGNWQANLIYYRVRDPSSEVFDIARRGTVRDLDMLFAKGQASPYDRDIHGRTLSHYAFAGYNKSTIEHLSLVLKLNPYEQDVFGLAASRYCAISSTDQSFLKEWFSMAQHDDILESTREFWFDQRKRREAFRLFLMRTEQSYESFHSVLCSEDDMSQLWSKSWQTQIIENYNLNTEADFIKRILQPYWDEDLLGPCSPSMVSYSLLRSTTHGLMAALQIISSNSKPYRHWAGLAKRILTNAPVIHHIERMDLMANLDPKNPGHLFLSYLQFGILMSRKSNISDQIHGIQQIWLSWVQTAGYDLHKYGQREHEIFCSQNSGLGRELLWRPHMYSKPGSYLKLRLRGFTFGPRLEDWKIFWSDPGTNYAADFWRIVEDRPRDDIMPGSWIDEDDLLCDEWPVS